MKPKLLLLGLGQQLEQTRQVLAPVATEMRCCATAPQARVGLKTDNPNLMVIQLDGNAPDQWLEVERLIGHAGGIPTLVVAENAGVEARIAALALGADDAMSLPFHPAELVARVEALARRQASAPPPREPLRCDGLELDPLSHQVRLDGRDLSLTPTEFGLLELLMQWPGRIFTRDHLARHLHGESERPSAERAIDVQVAGVRRKLRSSPTAGTAIETVRGTGYRLGH